MNRAWLLVLLPIIALPLGCQQQMADQPSYRPLQPAAFFANGMSARPLPAGVVARQWIASDDPLASGLKEPVRGTAKAAAPKAAAPKAAAPAEAAKASAPAPDQTSESAAGTPPPDAPTDPARFVADYPFALTRADLERGQERYTIFCAVCHDPIGTGHGKIVERGYVRPPNYHTDASRGFARYGKTIALADVPVGYLFEVITRGYGAMPRYAPQIPPRDRWRIAAYVRALQLSQHAVLGDLPPDRREAVNQALRTTP